MEALPVTEMRWRVREVARVVKGVRRAGVGSETYELMDEWTLRGIRVHQIRLL